MANPNGSNTFPFGGSIQIASGTAIIGAVDIDQTTPGSTNGVAPDSVVDNVVQSNTLSSAAFITGVPTTGYNTVGLAITSNASGNQYSFQGSNDTTDGVNGTWTLVVGYDTSQTTASVATASNNSSVRAWNINVSGFAYFRWGITNLVAGSTTGVMTRKRGATLPIVGAQLTGNAGNSINTGNDSVTTTSYQGVGSEEYLFNGATWDRRRANIDTAALVTLASAGATTVTSVDQTNYNGRGLQIGVSITTSTVPSLVVSVQGKDAASGVYYTMLTSTTIATTGFTNMVLYPGITATTNVASLPLPRTWRLQAVNGTNTLSATFGASVIL